jgi:hypothetical protein
MVYRTAEPLLALTENVCDGGEFPFCCALKVNWLGLVRRVSGACVVTVKVTLTLLDDSSPLTTAIDVL